MQKEQQTGQFEDLAHFLSGGGKGRGKAGAGATEKPAEGGLADLGDELTEAEAGGEAPGEDEALLGDEPSSDSEETTDETPAASPAGDEVQPPAARGPGFYHWLGGILLVLGIALGVLPDTNIVHILANAGFSANIVAIAGLVLLTTAEVLRAMKTSADRADWALSRQIAAAESLHSSVDRLSDDDSPRVRSSSDGSGDVTTALKRLDEKVNNLTRATKMYGKPLMELASQVTESAEVLNHVRTQTDLIAETIGQGLRKFSDTITDRLQKIEHGVTAIDASPVKHSLDKLETTTQKGFASLKGDDPGVTRVEQKLDASGRLLQEALTELKKGDLSKLEGTARDIQRELTALAATVANVQTTVATVQTTVASVQTNVANVQTTVASVQTNVANVQTTLKSQPARTAAPAAPAATAPQPAPAGNDAQSGAAQNTAGSHTGSGKNVLGAIAKLKQMKS